MRTLESFLDETILDSRDLIEAMSEWEAIAEDDEATPEERQAALRHLKDLQDFCEPFEGYSDWDYGETLIHESEWVDYVEEMLKECGYIPHDWPHWIHIDWETTARDVAVDYMQANGYYMRAC